VSFSFFLRTFALSWIRGFGWSGTSGGQALNPLVTGEKIQVSFSFLRMRASSWIRGCGWSGTSGGQTLHPLVTGEKIPVSFSSFWMFAPSWIRGCGGVGLEEDRLSILWSQKKRFR
jgi:hypothetical protein